MISQEQQVREEELSDRQRAFLGKLRTHDQRVRVGRDNGRLVFHGPIIGAGPMPEAEPGTNAPDDES